MESWRRLRSVRSCAACRFFFQAEDGIRDLTVTGVQTCALPISASASGGTAPYQYKWWLWNGTAWSIVQDWSASATFVWRPTTPNAAYQVIAWVRSAGNTADMLESYKQLAFARSEERRVGKECRSRWTPEH